MKKLDEVLKGLDLPASPNFSVPKRNHKDADADAWQFIELIQGWEKIVGPRLMHNSLPLKLLDGCLVLLVAHPAIAEQLKMNQLSLVRKIEKAYPRLRKKILKFGFKTNESIFKQKITAEKDLVSNKAPERQALHRFSPEYIKLKKIALELIGDCDDEEISESLTSIFLQMAQKK